MTEINVSFGGRVVIPKKFRDKLRIEEGDRVIVELRGREIMLRPKGIVENPVESLYSSVSVTPEESPKEVSRKWVRNSSK